MAKKVWHHCKIFRWSIYRRPNRFFDTSKKGIWPKKLLELTRRLKKNLKFLALRDKNAKARSNRSSCLRSNKNICIKSTKSCLIVSSNKCLFLTTAPKFLWLKINLSSTGSVQKVNRHRLSSNSITRSSKG